MVEETGKKIRRRGLSLLCLLAAVLLPLLCCRSMQASFTPMDNADYYKLTSCMSNMKNMGTALELYFQSHKRYPQRLGDICPGILSSLPRCPVTNSDTYSSFYRSRGNTYSLCCAGRNHVSLGLGADCPKYDAVSGLNSASSPKIEEIKTFKETGGVPYKLCSLNLKKLSTALDMFNSDHQGMYPQSLNQVVPTYIPSLPACPVARRDTYSLSYRSTPKTRSSYVIYCMGNNHGTEGLAPNFPRFDSANGLKIK